METIKYQDQGYKQGLYIIYKQQTQKVKRHFPQQKRLDNFKYVYSKPFDFLFLTGV